MTEPDNETRADAAALRVGLIADADELAAHADAVQACPALELCAQAGMPQQAGVKGVQWFDDTRVLVAQARVDALVIASSPRVGVNLGSVAVAHGVHVWRPPPLARNFAEALEVARQLQVNKVVYRVASWWDHVAEDIRWALSAATGCEPIFSEVEISTVGPPLQSWRSSQVDAAGGVLACDGYALLEALTAVRGVPESVMAATSKCRRRPSEARRETEDVVNAIFKYEAGGVARVRAAWDIPPYELATLHHGSESSVRYDPGRVAVLVADDGVREERPLPADFLATEMAGFAARIRDAARPAVRDADIRRHLAVSAILETTYLSSRTEQPESPRRLFEVQKWPLPQR